MINHNYNRELRDTQNFLKDVKYDIKNVKHGRVVKIQYFQNALNISDYQLKIYILYIHIKVNINHMLNTNQKSTRNKKNTNMTLKEFIKLQGKKKKKRRRQEQRRTTRTLKQQYGNKQIPINNYFQEFLSWRSG